MSMVASHQTSGHWTRCALLERVHWRSCSSCSCHSLRHAQVRTIDRICEIPHEGPFCDLMWSDPEDIETWAISPRGAGWLFGSRVTDEFNKINGCLPVLAARIICA